MKKTIFIFSLLVALVSFAPDFAGAADWKAAVPTGYKPITWTGARGISTFIKAPAGNGYLDYLTVVYLPYNQVKFVASSSPRVDWGEARSPFEAPVAEVDAISVSSTATSSSSTVARDWAFAKMVVENAKAVNPNMKFFWNVPFFNVEVPVTDLSMSLKSQDALGDYITSGSRPNTDIAQPRRMLIVNNLAGTSTIKDFDKDTFVSDGDQAVEGFSVSTNFKGSGSDQRLFIGVKPGGKELVIYCSQGATPAEASAALVAAGVPVENQLQADGGSSATCAYNLPGQYFVEPGRTLPHLMGAQPIVGRGVITEKLLNVRDGAGTKFKIVKKITAKTSVIIYESKNGWFRISPGNEWVLGSYVKQSVN